MSQLKVDNITDEEGTGAPNFPSGLTGVVPASSITGALNASGDAPIFACRAWVNFNGTGTVAIRESGNVSSITDNGVGDYTVNFATAMPDEKYSAVGTGGDGTINARRNMQMPFRQVPTPSSIRLQTHADSANLDLAFISITIFR